MCAAMRATARPFSGRVPSSEVAAAAPVRIGHDGLPADLVEGDVLRGVLRRGGDRHARENTRSGIARRPLQHLHAAHRAACDAEQAVDAEMVDQHGLRAHHVADGDRQENRARRVVPAGAAKPDRCVPMQPPTTLEQMTKKRSVSIGLPGPIIVSHQPGLPVSGWTLATCWSPVSAWQISTALLLAAFSVAIGLVGDREGR